MTIDNLTDSAAALDPQAREILDFWFGEPDSVEFGHARKVWFNGGTAFDDVLRTRYGALLDAACDGACDRWADTPLGALALIVVLDQFSRIHSSRHAARVRRRSEGAGPRTARRRGRVGRATAERPSPRVRVSAVRT